MTLKCVRDVWLLQRMVGIRNEHQNEVENFAVELWAFCCLGKKKKRYSDLLSLSMQPGGGTSLFTQLKICFRTPLMKLEDYFSSFEINCCFCTLQC